jgi:allantoinase
VWSTFPAKLAGLAERKGRLAPGYDADIVVWSPEGDADTRWETRHHRHTDTPYHGMVLKGKVLATFVGGSQVFADERGVAPAACGSTILPKNLLPVL